ncbi:major facilitator superfamily domain-containing protein [Protomyces lactucae-debilis]|uniref:Major facilitator superfamily domain-containing protein n=1 Tax=Protomyces lactucae-debilis TaxID=2754530 RepID=A0A1Y2FGU0_PROLT|nr:major facilitator superfamily domain-containing protein [Protomyces lactucae-debilis]ORY82624.1 major facilitator superfamily domain-containing protein [Protomyces lactucae-debilis]
MKADEAVTPAATDLDEATFRFCTPRQTKLILATLLICMLCAGLQAEVIGVAATTIATFFHAERELSWMGTVGALAQVTGVVAFGKAYDQFEPKALLLICLVLSIVGSIVSALSNQYIVLVAGQGLVGLSRAGIIVGNATVLAIICPDKKTRAFYLGFISGAYAIMIKVSPLVSGGLLALRVNQAWRGVFWVSVPIQGLLIPMVAMFPALRRRPARWSQLMELCPVRISLHSASLIFLLLPLTGGRYTGVLSFKGPLLISCYILGPILAAAFIYTEIRQPEENQMLPMNAIKKHPRMLMSLVILTISPALLIVSGTFYAPPYLEVVRGHSPFTAAALQLPSILLGSIAAVFAARLYHQGPRWAQGIGVIASILQILGSVIFYAFSKHVSIYLIHLSYSMTSIGAGLTFAMGMALIFEYVPESRFGAAASLMNLATSLGAVIGTSVYGLIFQGEFQIFVDRSVAAALAAAARELSSANATIVDTQASPIGLGAAPAFDMVYHNTQRYASLYLYGGAGLCSLVAALAMGRHSVSK